MGKFIEITESGAGRINFATTPSEYEGLYTQGLFSCAGIVIVGNEGIALIHDTDKLRLEDIQAEFQKVGEVVFWSLLLSDKADQKTAALDPASFKRMHPNGLFQTYLQRVSKAIKPLNSKLPTLFRPQTNPKEDSFYVTRQGEIRVNQKPSEVVTPPNLALRLSINRVNQFNPTQTLGKQLSPIDLQFDGEHFSDCAVLATQVENIINILDRVNLEPINSMVMNCIRDLKSTLAQKYRKAQDKELPSLTKTLRRAASQGNLVDVKNLCCLLGKEELNEPDDNPHSKKTALHWAVINQHFLVVRYLLEQKVDVNRRDGTLKTAKDYASNLSSSDIKKAFGLKISQVTDNAQVIEVFQYGVAYVEKNNALVSGILTRNLNVCLGLVFESQKALVVMHIDTNVDTGSVAEQLKGLEGPYSLKIINNNANLNKAMPLQSFGVPQFLERLKASLQKKQLSTWSALEQKNTTSGCFFVLITGGIVVDRPVETTKPPFDGFRTALNFINYLSCCDGTGFAKLTLDLQYNRDTWTQIPALTQVAKQLIELYRKASGWQNFISRAQQAGVFIGLIVLLRQQPVIEHQFKLYLEQEIKVAQTEIYPFVSKQAFFEGSLVHRLNQVEAEFEFFSMRDDAYRVDAIAYVASTTGAKAQKLKQLQKELNNVGKFFKTEEGKDIFVLEGINLPAAESDVKQTVLSYLRKFD